MKANQLRGWVVVVWLVLMLVGCSPGNGSDPPPRELDQVSVSGRVMDIHRDPIEGAVVTIDRVHETDAGANLTHPSLAMADGPISVTTDNEGAFSALVVPGRHTIRITMNALEIHRGAFTCSEDTPMDLGTLETDYDPASAGIDGDNDGYSPADGDCDDAAADVHPDADEVCVDGRDNDCDGETDCEDGDCAGDPACGTAAAGVLWIHPYDPTIPVATFEYAGGTAVRMTYRLEFRALGSSGSLELTAAVKADPADTAHLATLTRNVVVQAGQTYTLSVAIDVSSWRSCNPDQIDTIVISSPAASAAHMFDIFPFMDPDTNGYECIGRYGISDMQVDATAAAAGSPVAGYWKGTADFGEIDLRLTSDGTSIDQVRFDFQGFSCGNISEASGALTLSKESGWPVAADEVDLSLTLSRTLEQEMRLEGRFTDGGTNISGSYTADFNGDLCSGAWGATPKAE